MKFRKGDKVVFTTRDGKTSLKKEIYEPSDKYSRLYSEHHYGRQRGEKDWIENSQLTLTIETSRQKKFTKIV